MAEKGVHSLNEQGLEHACVLYDRRMLDFHHCDPELHNGCKHLLTAIRRFYGDRLGPVYILHMNWLFFGVFSYILKPFLTLFQNTDSMKMHAVQTPEELHEWFDEEHLLLDEMLRMRRSLEAGRLRRLEILNGIVIRRASNQYPIRRACVELGQDQDRPTAYPA